MKLKPLIRTHAGFRLLAAAVLGLSAMDARAAGSAPDLDGDGIPNIVDPDVDNDGIPNALDENVDGGIAKSGPYTGQYIGDHVNNDNPAEKDIDGDGLADDSLGETDIDGDSKNDNSAWEDDIDGDGRSDRDAAERDIDGDGRLDDELAEDDIDGDGLDDDDYYETDIDGDNSSDSLDDDIDGDGRSNNVLIDDDIDGDGRLNSDPDEDDDDGDGVRDRDDDDDNNDGIKDVDDDDHHNEDDEVEQKVSLTAGPQAPSGSSARVNLQTMATGKVELKVSARDLPLGNYQVVISGVIRATLAMANDDGGTRGRIEFETGNYGEDELPLNFPYIAEPLSIVQGGIVLFSGVIPNPPTPVTGGGGGGNPSGHSFIELLTPASGLPPAAKAEAEIDVGIAGVVLFEVELEDVAAGSYQVTIDGTFRGTAEVIAYPGKNSGRLRFKSVPETPDDLLLDFPVVGLPVIISQAGATIFSGTIPGGG